MATIRPGMAKPYYLRKDGMMEGTYVRIAGVIRKAEPYMIKELQLEGTGIPRIYQDAKEYGLQEPKLKDFGTSFRISIYRKDPETDVFGVVEPVTNATDANENATNNATDSATDNATNATNIKLSKNELTLLHCIYDHPTATQKESAEATGITIGTVKRLFPSLQKKAALKRNGNHKNGFWEVLIKIPE